MELEKYGRNHSRIPLAVVTLRAAKISLPGQAGFG